VQRSIDLLFPSIGLSAGIFDILHLPLTLISFVSVIILFTINFLCYCSAV